MHRKTLVGSNDAVGSVDRDASTLMLMMPLPTACMSVVVVITIFWAAMECLPQNSLARR